MRCIRDTPQRPYLPLGHQHHSVSSRNHCPSWGHACSGLASHSRNFWERDKLVTNICSFNGKDKTQAIVKKPTVYPCVLKRVDDCRELCSRSGKTLHSWGSFSSTVWFCLRIPASTGTPAAFSPFPLSVSLGQKAPHRQLYKLRDGTD